MLPNKPGTQTCVLHCQLTQNVKKRVASQLLCALTIVDVAQSYLLWLYTAEFSGTEWPCVWTDWTSKPTGRKYSAPRLRAPVFFYCQTLSYQNFPYSLHKWTILGLQSHIQTLFSPFSFRRRHSRPHRPRFGAWNMVRIIKKLVLISNLISNI